MSVQLQLRRGNTSQHSTFTGALAEITVDTDKKTIILHDGVTVGGIPLAPNTAFDVANAAFAAANSGGGGGTTNLTPVFTVANGGYTVANSAYGKANTVHTFTNTVYAAVNSSFSVINAAYAVANAAFNTANSAGGGGSMDYAYVNTSTGAANTYASSVGVAANTYAASVGVSANAYAASLTPDLSPVFTVANAAFDKANSANVLAYNTGIGANAYAASVGVSANAYAASLSPNLSPVFTVANAAFDKANSANVLAYNTGIGANAYAATVGTSTNTYTSATYSTLTQFGSVFGVANGAFAKANSALPASGGTVSGDLVVTGNLTTSGITTFANTQTLLIGDNILSLNADMPVSVAPSENAGIEVGRGSSANVSILWNEGIDKWTFTNDGTAYVQFASNTDVSTVDSRLTSAYGVANAAYGQANTLATSANAYAATVGTSANVYASSVGVAANTYAATVGTSANAYAATVGTSTNNYTSATYTTLTQFGSVFGVANAAYGQANTLATSANAYASTVGTSANAYAATVGTSSNNYIGGLANTAFATQSMTVSSLSDSSGTIAWDASSSRMATVTLSGTGRTVSNPTNLKAGSYVLVVKQDGTGSRTITTWGTAFKWPAGTAPVLSTTASTTDVFSFWCDGTNLYGTFIPDCR